MSAQSGMRVMHASWSRGALWVWGEDASGYDAAPAATSGDEGGGLETGDAAGHPFAMGCDDLEKIVRELRLGELIAGDGELSLALPSTPAGPTPSPHLAHALGHSWHDVDRAGDSELRAWSAPAIEFDAEAAPFVLDALEERLGDSLSADDENGAGGSQAAVGVSIQFFAAAGRFARSLIAGQRVMPMLVQRSEGPLEGAWHAWLSDERTSERLGVLLSAMPGAARAVNDDHGHQPWAILEDFLQRVTDALCRRALIDDEMVNAIEGRDAGDDSHVAWLTGLLGGGREALAPAPDRARMQQRVRQWVGRLDERGADVEWRLRLWLEEPLILPDDKSDGVGAAWELRFQLESVEDEETVIDAAEVWSLPSDAATVDGRRLSSPGELLLAELGRASRLFAPLERALDESEPTALSLTTAQAHQFLSEVRPLLMEQGVGVRIPAWWGSQEARVGLRLEIESEETAPDGSSGSSEASEGSFGLSALVDYRWRIAVGEISLTLAEFEELAASKHPLLRLKGRWVEVRQEDLAAASRFVRETPGGKMHLSEALRIAYGAAEDSAAAPIVGLSATGWVSKILGGDGEEHKFEMIGQPDDFVGSLRPYQVKGLSWMAFLDRLGLGLCLADDMGLGKTIQLLALMLHERERAKEGVALGPTLLVAPTSVVSNWRRESARFAPSLKVVVHHGIERLAGDAMVKQAEESDLVVTTYAIVHRDRDDMSRVSWRRVVLDEAQNIKNPAAKQTKSLRALTATRRVALTGTPVENRLSELWSIMDFCNPGHLGKLGEFKRRFAAPIERRHDKQKGKQLRALVRPFVLRRLKSDPAIAADLPEKIETKELCPLTPEQASMYEETVRSMLEDVDRVDGMQRRGVVLATLIRLKQICNHPDNVARDSGKLGDEPAIASRSGKCQRLLEMLEEVTAAGGQALVFTQFRRMGRLLSSMIMHDLDTEALFLHGGTPAKSREQLVDRFQRGDGSSPIFILSLKAGGLGMNLTAANHVFHFDRWWNPAVENQATDRAHRIGQTRTVHVHKFMVLGTLEERIDQMIEQKMELADSIISSGERWLTELSTDQLRDMLTLRTDSVLEEERV